MKRLSCLLLSVFLLVALASALQGGAGGGFLGKKRKSSDTSGEACIGKGFCDGSGRGNCVLASEAKHLGRDKATKYGNEFGGKCSCMANVCFDKSMKGSVCKCNKESEHSRKTRNTFDAPTDIKNAQSGFSPTGSAKKTEGEARKDGRKLTYSSGGSGGRGGRVGDAFSKYDKKQKAEAEAEKSKVSSKPKQQVSMLGKMMGYRSSRRV